MTVEREAAEIRLRQNVESERHVYLIMQKIDVYAAAERLDEHVKTCQRVGPRKLVAQETPPACGDGWHCDKAPIKEVEHGDES